MTSQTSIQLTESTKRKLHALAVHFGIIEPEPFNSDSKARYITKVIDELANQGWMLWIGYDLMTAQYQSIEIVRSLAKQDKPEELRHYLEALWQERQK